MQENLADSANIGINHVSKIEIAYNKPSFDTIIDIANALDVSLKELFDFEDLSS